MDEMRQKFLYTSLELEKLKVQMSEEMMKNQEYVKQLIQLLKMVCQERDEARGQLQKLLNNLDNPLVKATKANSSITESNSLSETYNYQSVESFFDAVSSPEFSNMNMADSNPVAYVNQLPLAHDNCRPPRVAPKVDKASLVIDSFVKGKPLPQQGKLLQAVLEAGPLLQTLLVSGQLPQWRNPPQLKPSNIPPVSIKWCESDTSNKNLGANLIYPASRSLHSQPYFDMSCGSSQMVSTSMLNFANSASASCLEDQRLSSAGPNMNSFVFLGKRQRNPTQRHQLNQQIVEDPDSQLQSRGLDSYVMHSLPITQFKKNDEQTARLHNSDCAVCLGEFQDSEWLKHLPCCSHVFHVACIDTWFQIHSSCPLCRSNVFSVKMQQEHSITMNSLLETLRREDFNHERSVHNEDIRSQILQNHSSRVVQGSAD
ncbi:hypothetical protein HAX54_049351 [Datura stramonium]|uniref:RING-type domain-containing protein n=1 Tax=Datura stramonium TaxID=4076 RepID=A0ABS8WKD7_DATST|nr:hypothetical protein [Datura stramonium]